MVPFTFIFVVALLINVTITLISSDWYKNRFQNTTSASTPSSGNSDKSVNETSDASKWNILIRKYLLVYLLATAADWLQGPYVYALYDEYKYAAEDIAVLFVAGFGSSMLFGSFVGGMADAGGRRTFVAWYAVIYGLSCVTKHFPNYYILLLGRILGGVATSLLFSVFDAWLIRAHADAGLGQNYLSASFAWAAYGNSITAIVAGLLADKVANANSLTPMHSGRTSMRWYMGGKLNPFDMALTCLVACGVAALFLWEENYGERSSKENSGKWYDSLRNAYYTIMRKQEILLCGAVSSLFEGSMYIFVFLWTPLLQASLAESSGKLPFGLIFSTFMVSCMAGSSLFRRQSALYSLETIAVWVFGVAAAAMAVTAVCRGFAMIQFLAMLVFEGTVGMYFPLLGTLKGTIVPEDQRAAIYNVFRIPLNCIVLFSLLTHLSPTTSFALNAVLLGTATVLMGRLKTLRQQNDDATEASEASELLLEQTPKDETV